MSCFVRVIPEPGGRYGGPSVNLDLVSHFYPDEHSCDDGTTFWMITFELSMGKSLHWTFPTQREREIQLGWLYAKFCHLNCERR